MNIYEAHPFAMACPISAPCEFGVGCVNLEGPKANIVSLGAALAACEQSGCGSSVFQDLCGSKMLPTILPADSQAVGGMDIRHLMQMLYLIVKNGRGWLRMVEDS